MSGFTPGPWSVFNGGTECMGIEAPSGSVIVFGGSDDDLNGIRGRTPDERAANANLTAAAPELYAAAEGALWAISNMAAILTAAGLEGTLTDPAPAIRAALAKARGAVPTNPVGEL